MNYARHRAAAKKKLESKKHELSVMSGEDRTNFEEHLIKEAHSEVEAQLKAENEALKKELGEKSQEIETKDSQLANAVETIGLKEKENEELLLANMELEEKLKAAPAEVVNQVVNQEQTVTETVTDKAPAEEVKLDTPPKGVLPHKNQNQNRNNRR